MDQLTVEPIQEDGDEDCSFEPLKTKVELIMKMMTHSTKQRRECQSHLRELVELLPGPPTPQKLSLADRQSEAAQHFTQRYYRNILEIMIKVMPQDELVVTWIEAGPAEETLNILMETLKSYDPCKRRDRIVQLIQHLITSEAFLFSCLRPCFALVERWRWEEEWLSPVISLPDALGNILKQFFHSSLSPTFYCRSVAFQLARSFFVLSEAMKHSVDVNVEPLALMVARLCAKYGPPPLLKPLLMLIDALIRDNYIARRIWSALVRALDDRCLEQVVMQAAEWARNPESFIRLVGALRFPLEDRWQRLLCSKILFLRGLTDKRIGRNVLTLVSQDQETLLNVSTNLLTVWSDKNALLLTSVEQHEFVTQCFLMTLDLIKPEELNKRKVEMHRLLREGVNHHLESPQMSVRVVGMYVAEVCTSRIHPEGAQLKFEYDETLVLKFKNLLNPENEEEQKSFEDLLIKFQEEDEQAVTATSNSKKSYSKGVPQQVLPTSSAVTEELDSDDDLEPYDMSEDTAESQFEAPHYIRDLMEMLGNVQNEAEEYEKHRLALGVAEDIIRQQLPQEHPSLTEPLLSILIHLQDKFGLPDFLVKRRKALIATGISQPTETARYLTCEFYQVNYSVVQRLDMLHVVAAIAEELSSQPPFKPSDPVSPARSQDIVQQRIDSKTRRFFPSSSTRRDVVKFVNRFTQFAGLFFFPLAEKLDRCLVHLSLMDQDFVLLSELLRTLAVVLHCTGPVPIVRRMARSLVDSVWVLRLHEQPKVRQAALVAFIQSLLSLDGHQLASDYSLEINDWKDWLLASMERDPDAPVRELAQNAIALLANLLN